MTWKAEVYQRSDGRYDWRMKAENNEIVATSGGQGYNERNDAAEALVRLVENMPVDIEVVEP